MKWAKPNVTFRAFLVLVLLISVIAASIVLRRSKRERRLREYLRQLESGMTREEVVRIIPEQMLTTNRPVQIQMIAAIGTRRGSWGSTPYFAGTTRPAIASEIYCTETRNSRVSWAVIFFDGNGIIVERIDGYDWPPTIPPTNVPPEP